MWLNDIKNEAEILVRFELSEQALVLLMKHGVTPAKAVSAVNLMKIMRRIRVNQNRGGYLVIGKIIQILLCVLALISVGWVVFHLFMQLPLSSFSMEGTFLQLLAESDFYAVIFELAFLALAFPIICVFLMERVFFHAWFWFLSRVPADQRHWMECTFREAMTQRGSYWFYFVIRARYVGIKPTGKQSNESTLLARYPKGLLQGMYQMMRYYLLTKHGRNQLGRNDPVILIWTFWILAAVTLIMFIFSLVSPETHMALSCILGSMTLFFSIHSFAFVKQGMLTHAVLAATSDEALAKVKNTQESTPTDVAVAAADLDDKSL